MSAAEKHEPESDSRVKVAEPAPRLPRHLAETLRRALTGGLHVQPENEGDYGCSIEAAMAHIAASQLRAIRFAMVMGDPDDSSDDEDERRAWCVTGKFTRTDAVAALGGVEALLRESHGLADDIREALKSEGGGQ